jgi:enterochelin esterase-like enzyme
VQSVIAPPGPPPPAWLQARRITGRTTELVVTSSALGADVRIRLWGPHDAPDAERLPLLVAHDGPQFDDVARLTDYAAAQIAVGRLPRHRVALLDSGDRNQWYSASALYARALVTRVLPALAEATAVHRPVGMGASLGALAMLHAHRRFPDAFAGLFLQSGSFFVPRFDAHESGFPRYRRIVRFVRSALRERPRRTVPVALTCGEREENVHNNRVMASALAAQGYRARLVETGDLHDVTAWRNAFDPHLTRLLHDVWASPES